MNKRARDWLSVSLALRLRCKKAIFLQDELGWVKIERIDLFISDIPGGGSLTLIAGMVRIARIWKQEGA